MLVKIVSGGQTGVDRGALEAARALGLETGGWAPAGWRTERGCDPSLADFGMVECDRAGYCKRTRLNVRDSDATLWIGDNGSPGFHTTYGAAKSLKRPFFRVSKREAEESVLSLVNWLHIHTYNVERGCLNVAGHRGSTWPNGPAVVRALLLQAIPILFKI